MSPLLRVCWTILGAGLIGAVLGGCRPKDDVVAVVEATPITTVELADAYARLVVQAGLPGDDPQLRSEVLDNLINRQLVIQEAWDAGIRETAAYREAEARLRRKLLVDAYTNAVLYDTLQVTDAELRHLFVQANTVYEARHLFAHSLQQAEQLRARLERGETFEALAREVFADSALANNGGYLGEFRHDEMDPAFEAAAFALPIGAISEPVRTAQGYSIIRVEHRATRPMLTESEFASKQDQLLRYANRRRRTEARFAHSRRVRDELSPQFDEATLAELAALAAGERPVAQEAPEAWSRRPLVHFTSAVQGVQTWSVGDVEAMAAAAGEAQRAAVRDKASLREFIEGLIVREELVARAQAQHLDRGAYFTAALDNALGDWVFDQAQQRLRTQFAPPEDSLRAHFAAHHELYLTPERVRVREILVETRREADALRSELAASADFATLARTHSLRPGASSNGGDLGLVDRSALGLLADPVFDARPGQVVGPLEVAGRYVLLERGVTEPPRPMAFDEARDQVAQNLELQYAQARLLEHIGRLRARYAVEVRQDALRRVNLLS